MISSLWNNISILNRPKWHCKKLDCFHFYSNFGIARQICKTLSLSITTSENSFTIMLHFTGKMSSPYHINIITLQT